MSGKQLLVILGGAFGFGALCALLLVFAILGRPAPEGRSVEPSVRLVAIPPYKNYAALSLPWSDPRSYVESYRVYVTRSVGSQEVFDLTYDPASHQSVLALFNNRGETLPRICTASTPEDAVRQYLSGGVPALPAPPGIGPVAGGDVPAARGDVSAYETPVSETTENIETMRQRMQAQMRRRLSIR